jgi:hypothetical protein
MRYVAMMSYLMRRIDMRLFTIARASKLAAIALSLIAFAIAVAGDVPFKGSAIGAATPVGVEGGIVQLHTAASGHCTLLGNFTSAEELLFNPGTGQIAGSVVFTAANGATLYGTTAAQFISANTVVGTYTITGGTGRLEGASGSADFVLVTPDGSNYTVEFAGSLSSH